MTIKQTDREQISDFGDKGIALFDAIETELKSLVEETAEVAYRGANALEFKTKCSTNAVEFAGQCTKIMQEISAVVTDNTTFIATALGGQPISLEAPVIAIEMPRIDADTSVESADSGPLEALRESTKARFDQVETNFGENLDNLTALGADGWIGPEYDECLVEVTRLTASIVETIGDSGTVMMTDITNQLQALGME